MLEPSACGWRVIGSVWWPSATRARATVVSAQAASGPRRTHQAAAPPPSPSRVCSARGFALVRERRRPPLRSGRPVTGAHAAGDRVFRRPSSTRSRTQGRPRPPPSREPRARGGTKAAGRGAYSARGEPHTAENARFTGFVQCRRNDYLRANHAPTTKTALANRYDRAFADERRARSICLDGRFPASVRPGAFVAARVTGVPIPLEELKYWRRRSAGGPMPSRGGGAPAAFSFYLPLKGEVARRRRAGGGQ